MKILIYIMLLMISLPLAAQDGTALLNQAEGYQVSFDAFVIDMTLTAMKNDEVMEEVVYRTYIDGPDKSLVLQMSGKNRLMKILYREENLWVSLPGSRRPLRITPMQRLMGQASNGDVARIGWVNDYTAQLEAEERVGGVLCNRLKLTARRRSSTYATVTLWLRVSDARPVKARFFAASGKCIKWATYDSYRKQGNIEMLQQMTIHDAIRPAYKTVFSYGQIKEESLPARYYNKNHLVHVDLFE